MAAWAARCSQLSAHVYHGCADSRQSQRKTQDPVVLLNIRVQMQHILLLQAHTHTCPEDATLTLNSALLAANALAAIRLGGSCASVRALTAFSSRWCPGAACASAPPGTGCLWLKVSAAGATPRGERRSYKGTCKIHNIHGMTRSISKKGGTTSNNGRPCSLLSCRQPTYQQCSTEAKTPHLLLLDTASAAYLGVMRIRCRRLKGAHAVLYAPQVAVGAQHHALAQQG